MTRFSLFLNPWRNISAPNHYKLLYESDTIQKKASQGKWMSVPILTSYLTSLLKMNCICLIVQLLARISTQALVCVTRASITSNHRTTRVVTSVQDPPLCRLILWGHFSYFILKQHISPNSTIQSKEEKGSNFDFWMFWPISEFCFLHGNRFTFPGGAWSVLSRSI